MNQRIYQGVEKLFENAPRTRKIQDLKEELAGNLEARYQDLIGEGMSEDEAYTMAFDSIGNIDEVVATMVYEDPLNIERIDRERKKTALVVATAVGLYIFAIIALIFIQEFFGNASDIISVCAFFMIAGAATCLLVYHFLSRPSYIKADASIVEEFKEWKQVSTKKKQVCQSVTSIMWTLIVAIYFLVSFTFMNWYCSWIIFIIGAVLDRIIKLFFEIHEFK